MKPLSTAVTAPETQPTEPSPGSGLDEPVFGALVDRRRVSGAAAHVERRERVARQVARSPPCSPRCPPGCPRARAASKRVDRRRACRPTTCQPSTSFGDGRRPAPLGQQRLELRLVRRLREPDERLVVQVGAVQGEQIGLGAERRLDVGLEVRRPCRRSTRRASRRSGSSSGARRASATAPSRTRCSRLSRNDVVAGAICGAARRRAARRPMTWSSSRSRRGAQPRRASEQELAHRSESYSPRGLRPISEATRSPRLSPSRIRQTPSVIGSSIPRRCERSRSTGAVVRPSTTWPISATASSGGRAPRDQLAGVAVAAEAAVAGDDQVAHPGEAGERLRPGAARLAQPRHLGQAARDQRRLARCRRGRGRRRRRRRARSRSSPPRRARRRRGRG